MKAREILIGLVGFLVGIFVGFLIYKKRKELLKRLEALSEVIQESDVYEKVRHQVADIREYLIKFIEGAKELPSEKEDEILNIVEDKIRKLEDIIKS